MKMVKTLKNCLNNYLHEKSITTDYVEKKKKDFNVLSVTFQQNKAYIRNFPISSFLNNFIYER